MPELPEVEVVRRGLERWVAGRTVATASVLHERAARRHVAGGADLAARLTGRTIETASRRGKYLWLPLDGRDAALVAHLGMSGQLLVQEPGSPDEKHLRARLAFTDGGRELRFVDQRTFGGLALDDLVPDSADGRVPASVAHIARDPLDPLFDDALWVRRLRSRQTGLKRALLDQTLVSRHRQHLRRRGALARPPALGRAADAVAPARAARAPRPRSRRDGGRARPGRHVVRRLYVNVNGESGYFDRSLAAYGQADRPCPRCGRPIVREAFMNRSSYRCPRCQRTPRSPRW